MANAGLKVRHATYFNMILFPAAVGSRVLANLWGGNCGRDMEIPSKPVNKILETIFSLERLFLPGVSFPFGLFILVIAQ